MPLQTQPDLHCPGDRRTLRPGSWFSCRYVSVEVDAGAGVGVDGEGAADGAAAAIARKLALPGSDGWIRLRD